LFTLWRDLFFYSGSIFFKNLDSPAIAHLLKMLSFFIFSFEKYFMRVNQNKNKSKTCGASRINSGTNSMAHNLNFNERLQRHSFFSVKEKAWHSLGVVLDKCPTSADAIKLAGLDYDVAKTPVLCNPENLGSVVIPDKFATYRTDTKNVFGIVGDRYSIVQNRDAFTFFDEIVGEGAAIYETAGCLGNGEIIFITAKLPDYIRVGNDDLIEQYLFLTSSHDGSGAIQVAFTPVRIVCNNTLNFALKNCSNKLTIRHTESAKNKLAQGHKVMGIVHKVSDELSQAFNQMAKVKITDPELVSFIKKSLAPNKEALTKIEASEELSTRFTNMISDCYLYAATNHTQQMETTAGTLFGAYNAVTGYFQNVKNYKNDEVKLKGILEGSTFNQTQDAFNLALSMM
jgi:phage/plasmid-like protein (TIGR03299 family)